MLFKRDRILEQKVVATGRMSAVIIHGVQAFQSLTEITARNYIVKCPYMIDERYLY